MSITEELSPSVEFAAERKSPTYQAYQVLHVGFTAAPVIAGADKFLDLLTNWDQYLAPPVVDVVGGHAHAFMLVVGVVEMIAGLLVAIKPKLGAYVVAAWLVGIMVNLLLCGRYFDIALRDLGLCLGAIALGRLAMVFDSPSAKRPALK